MARSIRLQEMNRLFVRITAPHLTFLLRRQRSTLVRRGPAKGSRDRFGSRLPMANLGVGYTQRGARAFMTERMDQTVALGTEGGSEPGAGPASGFESFFMAE